MNGVIQLDLQQLKYFQTVARMEHMTRASEKLNISQPALSKAIEKLEGEIGAPLFDRVGRAIRLNRFGRIFLERTLPLTTIFEEAKQEIQDLQSPNSGTVFVGFTHSMGTQILSKMVRLFQQKNPNIQFEFIQRNSQHLLEDLSEGKCDLCLTPFVDTDLNVEWQELWNEEVFVVVPENHPLANKESIHLEEIANEPIITIKEGNSLRQIQTKAFAHAGITPNIVFEGEEFHTVASFVDAGFGVGLLPSLHKLDGYHVKRLSIKDFQCERRLGLVTMKNRYLPEVTKKFMQFINDQLEK